MKKSECSNEEILEELQDLQEEKELVEEDSDVEELKDQITELKDKLVKKNIPLVKSIAGDFIHSGLDFEDLRQAGYIGLLNAVENFDLNQGAKFSTYATHLIKGEIRHQVRDNQPSVHIPQWVKRLNKKVKKAQEKVYQRTGEFPTVKELSDELNIEEEGIKEVLKARDSMTYVSIDKERRESDPRPEYIDYEKIRSKHKEDLPLEFKVRIADAIEKLTEVQQQVVKGLFYEERTQEEVGEEIGSSQRQVSRMKYRLLDELKEHLEEGSGEEKDNQ
ncbi:sigma-70 family RNA polymerase sigma factor [Candidatus Bipolaricaulota bacterium]|nr:sigma-70 family RNA polymerase sigma factor [Candidatus Bipolaricaulota bacterium]MBS3825177.1 sigma-70 family RNA polymerase sigma factor [Candidatus Bipolaricaulota bacterium]